MVAIAPAGFAAWLAWRLLEQDRIIANERLRDLRERDADELVQSVARSLGLLARELRGLAPGTVESPDAPLAFSSQPQPLPEAATETFQAGEKLEFSPTGAESAIASYRRLTESPSPAVRAGAWLRLARTLRKAGRREEAIQAYRQLASLPQFAVGGVPARLAGLWALGTIREEAGEAPEVKKEGEALRDLLESGKYSLSRGVDEAYAEDAARWSGKPRPVVREALSDAALSRPSGSGAGEISWRPTHHLGRSGQPHNFIDRGARLALPPLPNRPGAKVSTGRTSAGETLRRAEDTGLPWTLAIALANPAREVEAFATQRRLLLGLLWV